MTSAVLDASAIIALLKNEAGAAKVAAVIADAAVGVFNHAEVVSHFIRLRSLPVTVLPADEALGWEAGRLRNATSSAGLSLGDRFCLALARRMDVPAYTADTAWTAIAGAVGVKVVSIR